MSGVYFYKATNIYGVKVDGREVIQAGVNSACRHPSSFCSNLLQVGGKYYDAKKSKEIAVRASIMMGACLLNDLMMIINFVSGC